VPERPLKAWCFGRLMFTGQTAAFCRGTLLAAAWGCSHASSMVCDSLQHHLATRCRMLNLWTAATDLVANFIHIPLSALVTILVHSWHAPERNALLSVQQLGMHGFSTAVECCYTEMIIWCAMQQAELPVLLPFTCLCCLELL